MTCREFKHSAASLTLWELLQAQDEQILTHAEQCEGCGGWLQNQRTVAASLHTLQAQTAALEASPRVERTLLRAFRQATAENAPQPMVTRVSAPTAFRLSHFFEVGAYVAVAAAIIVSVFLGIRLLQHSSRTVLVQSGITPGSTRPLMQKPVVAAQADSARLAAAVANRHVASVVRSQYRRGDSANLAIATVQTAAAEDSQTDADTDYIALMFCDPLSCSSDSQVVRMELPANGAEQNSQPAMADVVVGYDGVVRAVRIVN
ncbi:MAG: hypothetical protein ACLPPV_10705 [Candidatus Korobacteraceae bacterium]